MRTRFLLALVSGSAIWLGCSSSDSGNVDNGATPPPSGQHGTADGGGGGGGRSEDGAPPPSDDDGAASDACPPSWTLTPACGGTSSVTPDFGPNVVIVDPSMGMDAIQSKLGQIDAKQDAAQFGSGRYAYFFKPGSYDLDVRIGFYVQALGLGRSPDDVKINGAVRVVADWLGGNNATCNFWRGAENLSVTPSNGDANPWGVSQGTHFRRMHMHGDVRLDAGGWASGGFVADSVFDGSLDSGTQQQFLTRNDDYRWQGANWNMVFVGNANPPKASWPAPPYTVTEKTPRIREKPFLYLDDAGHYLVMVPRLKTDSQGPSWKSGDPPGSPLPIDAFYIAKPADDAGAINAALDGGKNVLFTPGIYHLKSALHVSRPGTILLGLGLATLVADSGNGLVEVDDVGNVTLAGLLLEAGPASSPTLLTLGQAAGGADHSRNPTALFDVHCRVGGANAGTAKVCVTVNSNDVIIDNMWLWRADHGAGADWNVNKANSGIVVNGDRVTAYGLFSEHFQQYQTLWNGNDGAVYFYQSEMPYDPPDQGAWQAAPGHDGYPSYKVADGVKSHHAEGLGVYSVFWNGGINAQNAFEAPSGVDMHHMVIVSLASGTIRHILNGTGDTVGNGKMTAYSGD